MARASEIPCDAESMAAGTPINLVIGVGGPADQLGSWANDSAINTISGSSILPITSTRNFKGVLPRLAERCAGRHGPLVSTLGRQRIGKADRQDFVLFQPKPSARPGWRQVPSWEHYGARSKGGSSCP